MLALEIALLAAILLVGTSIAWSTCRVGISPMPSSGKARDAIFKMLEDAPAGSVYDLGSGWGGLVIPLAKKYPDREIVGYEVSFVPWLVSVLFKTLFRLDNLEVRRKNFLQADLSGADVLVCYLHTDGMRKLAQKLAAERDSGGVLISNNFALPTCRPETAMQINDFYKSPVYRYRLQDLV